MAKESSNRLVLLHADSSPSEKRNQFALLMHQLFVDPKKDERTGEMVIERNKVNNQVKHIATALMVLKRSKLPQKEVFRSFLESTKSCNLQEEERNKLCKVFDLDDQEAQSFDQFETPPRKTTPQTRCCSRQEQNLRRNRRSKVEINQNQTAQIPKMRKSNLLRAK